MPDPTLASNNPFRRKAATTTLSSPAAPPPAPAAAADALPTAARLPLSLDAPFGSASAATAAPTLLPASRPDEAPFFFPSDPSGPAGRSGPPASLFPSHPPSQEPVPPQQHPTGNEFRDQLRAMPKVTTEAPPSTTFLKPKPVKKVRVQSPPPSSPNSVDSDFEARFPADLGAGTTTDASTRQRAASPPYYYNGHNDDDDEDDDDDESSESEDSSSSPDDEDTPAGPLPKQTVAPPNPFEKTLQDLEATKPIAPGSEGAPGSEKGTMDVDAFRRLLLTGQPAGRGGSEASNPPGPDVAHQAQETPKSSLEISENYEAESGRGGLVPAQRQAARPKPPPPSSRHGKKIQGQREDAEEGSRLRARSTSDARKAAEVGVDPSTVFDADAAPTAPGPLTPPTTSHVVSGTDSLGLTAAASPSPPTTKKATPAPPPRRQAHARAESRASPSQAGNPAAALSSPPPPLVDRSPAGSGRSSLDSSTTASAHAPPAPPPPPRRATAASHASRLSVSPKPSPTAAAAAASDKERPPAVPWPGPGASSSSSGGDGAGGSNSNGNTSSSSNSSSGGGGGSTGATATPAPPMPASVAKLAKPPPPPTRGASLRRKERPALSSHTHAHPPPPPPRQRGSSRGSMDAPAGQGSAPSALAMSPLGTAAAQQESTAHLILADLDALQREVDALRGQYGKS